MVGGVRGRVREWVSECPPWEATMIMVLVLAVSPVVLTLLPRWFLLVAILLVVTMTLPLIRSRGIVG